MYKRLKYIYPFIVFFVAGVAYSQPVQGLSERKLNNGLDVIILQNNAAPIVTVEIAAKNGSFTEPPEYNGLSHLYEHMFYKADSVLPSQQYFLQRVGELGAIWNGRTETERVFYYFTLPSYNLDPGLKFLSDCIRKPLFDSVELEKERHVVIGEIDRNESLPFFTFQNALDDSLWWKYPSRKNPLGNRQTVLSANRAKMYFIKNKYYIPNNAALIIGGDVNVDSALYYANKYFADWKPGPDPFTIDPVPEHPPLPHKELVVVPSPGIPYVLAKYQFQGPSIGKDDKSTWTADVFFDMLTRPTSRLQHRLVDGGYAQGVSEIYITQRHTGPISVTIQTVPAKFDTAMDLLRDEMSHWDDTSYFSDSELANTKEAFRLREIYDQQSTSNYVLETLCFWWCSASLDYYMNYVKNIQTVTKKDVAEFVDKYIKNKNYVLGVSSSRENLQALKLDKASLLKF